MCCVFTHLGDEVFLPDLHVSKKKNQSDVSSGQSPGVASPLRTENHGNRLTVN